MEEEFKHLGLQIKQARENKNLSLKEIENAISIRINLLKSIEEGDLKGLISPVYAQGFIKKYASFLELDGEGLIIAHPQVDLYLSQKKPEEFTFLGSIEVRGSPGHDMKWLPNVLWVGGSMLAILTLWFIARHLGFF